MRGSFLNKNLIVILGILILLLVLTVAFSLQVEATPTPTSIPTQNKIIMTPTNAPVRAVPSIEVQVPYSKTSIWNTPIGSFPKYDVYSEEMIATLKLANDGRIITGSEAFNHPVYFADEQTPRWDVSCIINKCTIASSDQEITRTEMVENVPIPENAKPGNDSDGRMIIIDTVTYTEYNLSKARRTETGWEAGTVSVYNILWDGTPVGHSSRGSGIPALAGLLRPWEILEGKIEHALAFGYTHTANDKCVFPASKTDGKTKRLSAIPMGARLQLDPSLTDADFDQMGLSPTGKIIARALQEYGMFVVDTSGSFKMYVEDLINNPYATEQWTDPELNLTKETIYNIPYTAFRILELPPGYWEDSKDAVYHGQCLAFPKVP